MNKEQRKVLNYILITLLLIVFIILVYIFSRPLIEKPSNPYDEISIEVSEVIKKNDSEISLSEKLLDINQVQAHNQLQSKGYLLDLNNSTSNFTLLIPTNDFINPRKFILNEEIYTNTLSLPYSVQNDLGDTVTINSKNGELIISYGSENYFVVEPDIRFMNGSIFLISKQDEV